MSSSACLLNITNAYLIPGNFCFSFVFGYGKYANEVETKEK